MPLYLVFIIAYTFAINFSYYMPETRLYANLIKSTWFSYVSVFEANAYFETSEVEFLKVFELQFLNCDTLMWKYWLFHIAALMLPSFE